MELAGLFLFFLLQGCIFRGFCSYIAAQKERSRANWFILRFLFSFLALLTLIAIPRIEKYEIRRPSILEPIPSLSTLKVTTLANPAERTCPFCAESIKAAAKICRFCQRDMPPMEVAQTINSSEAQDEDRPDVIDCRRIRTKLSSALRS